MNVSCISCQNVEQLHVVQGLCSRGSVIVLQWQWGGWGLLLSMRAQQRRLLLRIRRRLEVNGVYIECPAYL